MLVNIGNRTSFIDSYTDKFKFELDIGQICVSVPVFFNISSVFGCYYRNTICSLIRLYERFLVLVLYNFCVQTDNSKIVVALSVVDVIWQWSGRCLQDSHRSQRGVPWQWLVSGKGQKCYNVITTLPLLVYISVVSLINFTHSVLH